MQKHLEQVITTAGLSPDDVKKILELPDDAPDFNPDTYIKPLQTTIEGKVKNDPEFWKGLDKKNIPPDFLKTIEGEQYGRAATIARTNLLKAVGLSEKDFADLGDDGKKLEVFTPAFARKLADGKVTDKELQQKLMDANGEIEKLKGLESEIEKKYSEKFTTDLANGLSEFVVMAEVSQVPGLKVPAEYVSDKVLGKLQSKYALVPEGKTLVVRQKENPQLKVLIENGTKELTLRGAIVDVLESDNLLEKETTTKKTTVVGGKTDTIVEGDKGLKLQSHVNDKLQKRIDEEKKAQGSAK